MEKNLDENPYRPPAGEGASAPRMPLARLMARGAIRGGLVLGLGAVVLLALGVVLALVRGTGPRGRDFWMAVANASAAIPLLTIVGVLVGAALAVAMRGLGRR